MKWARTIRRMVLAMSWSSIYRCQRPSQRPSLSTSRVFQCIPMEMGISLYSRKGGEKAVFQRKELKKKIFNYRNTENKQTETTTTIRQVRDRGLYTVTAVLLRAASVLVIFVFAQG